MKDELLGKITTKHVLKLEGQSTSILASKHKTQGKHLSKGRRAKRVKGFPHDSVTS